LDGSINLSGEQLRDALGLIIAIVDNPMSMLLEIGNKDTNPLMLPILKLLYGTLHIPPPEQPFHPGLPHKNHFIDFLPKLLRIFSSIVF